MAYTTKWNAKEALVKSEDFFEGVAYQILKDQGLVQRPQGGTVKVEKIFLSVQCLEFFIARKIRPIFEAQDPRIPCENCGAYEGVEAEDGRTAYDSDLPWDHVENPNRDVWLCRDCAAIHHENWDDMWADYYQGRL